MAEITVTVTIRDSYSNSSAELTEHSTSGNPLFHATEIEKMTQRITDRVCAVFGSRP